jgi:hypothetical protein
LYDDGTVSSCVVLVVVVVGGSGVCGKGDFDEEATGDECDCECEIWLGRNDSGIDGMRVGNLRDP